MLYLFLQITIGVRLPKSPQTPNA